MGNGLLAGKHEKTPPVREISTYIWMQLAGNHILTTFAPGPQAALEGIVQLADAPKLEIAQQAQQCLLRFCSNTTLVYFLRTMPPSLTIDAARRGVRRTSKKRRGGRIDIGAAGVNTEKSCFPKGEEKQGPESDSDRDTDAATADSGENEVRRRNMRECEDAMMEDTASRRGYAPTAAWDEGNMIQAMARMKNPTIAWRFGDG